MTDYVYSVATDITAQKVDPGALQTEIQTSTVSAAVEGISVVGDVLTVSLKNSLPPAEVAILNDVVLNHSGEPVITSDEVRTPDGRLRVRSDSLPIGTTTSFTSQGDSPTEIGAGKEAFWDFSNDDDLIAAPAGYKRKSIMMTFVDPVFVKEGAIYYHDAVKGSYADVKVMCPEGGYYYDRQGNPAMAIGGILCIEVTVPDTDSGCFGWGSIELYRTRTVLLPGESV